MKQQSNWAVLVENPLLKNTAGSISYLSPERAQQLAKRKLAGEIAWWAILALVVLAFGLDIATHRL